MPEPVAFSYTTLTLCKPELPPSPPQTIYSEVSLSFFFQNSFPLTSGPTKCILRLAHLMTDVK